MLDYGLALVDVGDLEYSAVPDHALTFRKQVIYEDTFHKDSMKFTVDSGLITHWISQFNAFSKAGIEVPVPEEHTTKPGAKRGSVKRLESGPDKKGRNSLWAIVEFSTEEYAKQFKAANVSLYSPPKFEDGKGRTYYRPITHIALTDYPVVPDLGEFETISASLTKESPMPLKALAKELGIEVKDDASDVDLASTIKAKFGSLKAALKEARDQKKPDTKPEESKKDEKKDEEKPQKIAASLVNMVTNARKTQIGTLVREGKITKAVADALEEQHCGEDTIRLSLSADDDDGFENTIAALSKNDAVIKFEEQTGGQGISLDSKDNPLMAFVKQRREQANAG